MKIKFWAYPENCGDGSAAVRLFNTREDAEKYQEVQERLEGWAEDCVSEHTIVVKKDGTHHVEKKWYHDEVE